MSTDADRVAGAAREVPLGSDPRRQRGGSTLSRLGFVAGFAVIAGYSWWVTDLVPDSQTMLIAVVGVSVAVLVAARVTRRRQIPTVGEVFGFDPPRRRLGRGLLPGDAVAPGHRRGLIVWSVLIATVIVWQLFNFVQLPREDYPTISLLANAVNDTHVTRTVTFMLYLALGWNLARR